MLGNLDNFDGASLNGWAWGGTSRFGPVTVELLEGPHLIAVTTADRYREDLLQAGIGTGFHAFSFPLPSALFDGRPHALRIRIAEFDVVLPGCPIVVEPDPSQDPSRVSQGWVDYIDGSWVGGEVAFAKEAGQSLAVELVVNGSVVAAQTLTRPAISDKGQPENPPVPFRFAVPGQVRNRHDNEIRIRFADTGADLDGSPLAFNSGPFDTTPQIFNSVLGTASSDPSEAFLNEIRRLSEAYPACAEVHFLVGMAAFRRDLYEESFRSFAQAIHHSPELTARLQTFFQKDAFKPSSQAIEQGLSLFPELGRGAYDIVVPLLLKAGRTDDANKLILQDAKRRPFSYFKGQPYDVSLPDLIYRAQFCSLAEMELERRGESARAIESMISRGTPFQGENVLCLVESGADLALLEPIVRSADAVDFLTVSPFPELEILVRKWVKAGKSFTVKNSAELLDFGSDAEAEAGEGSTKLANSIAEQLEIYLSSSSSGHLKEYAQAVAFAAEPLLYLYLLTPITAFDEIHKSKKYDSVALAVAGGWESLQFTSAILTKYPSHQIFVRSSALLERDGTSGQRIRFYKENLLDSLLIHSEPPTLEETCDRTQTVKFAIALEHERLKIEREIRLTHFEHSEDYAVFLASHETQYDYVVGWPRDRLVAELAQHFTVDLAFFGSDADRADDMAAALTASIGPLPHDIRALKLKVDSGRLRSQLSGLIKQIFEKTKFQTFRYRGYNLFRAFWYILADRVIEVFADHLMLALHLERRFALYPPKIAVAFPGAWPQAELTLRAARRHGAVTFDTQPVSVVDEPRTRAHWRPKADFIYTMDPLWSHLLWDFGWPKDSTIVTGTPHLDRVLLSVAQKGKLAAEGRSVMKLKTTEKLLLFTTSTLQISHALQVLRVLRKICEANPDIRLLVKPHPRERQANLDAYVAAAGPLVQKKRIVVDQKIDIKTAICSCDLLVAILSNTVLEAALFDVPVLVAHLSGRPAPKPADFQNWGLAEAAYTVEEISRKVNLLLFDPAFREGSLARQQDAKQSHPQLIDGRSVERIVGDIERRTRVSPLKQAAAPPRPRRGRPVAPKGALR